MKQIKSERLKKLELELHDLEEWLKLGLVPKKDITKHKEEIRNLHGKIGEEKERLQFLKESGEAEEYVTPKRSPPRPGYADMPSIPDIEADAGTMAAGHDTEFEMDAEPFETETVAHDEKEEEEEHGTEVEAAAAAEPEEEEEEESYFNERDRWRRGGIVDPDANEW